MNTAEDHIASWCGLILMGGALCAIPLWVGFNGFFGLFEIAFGGASVAYGCLRVGRVAGVRPRRRRRSHLRLAPVFFNITLLLCGGGLRLPDNDAR